MHRAKRRKFNIKLFMCFCMIFCFVYLVYGVNYKVKAIASDVVTITYTNPTGTGSNISINTNYDDRLYSMLLIDYGTNGTDKWSHSDIVVSEEGKADINYKASFAGWKLTKINGEDYTGTTFFYPDHDYVYMNDAPYVGLSNTITSLEFEALWGKTVYLRDKYNYNDITCVYSDRKTATMGWNTNLSYSSDDNSGNTDSNPVSTLARAEEIIGIDGGKIVVVNHYTFEAAPNQYPDHANYTNESTHTANIYIGSNVSSGVLTISGLNQGKLNEDVVVGTKKSEVVHTNSTLYLRNTKGYGKYGNANYTGLSMRLRLQANIVFENVNCAGYRESYVDGGGSRATADGHIYLYRSNRYVFEDTFRFFKLGTKTDGSDNADWSFSDFNTNKSRNGSKAWVLLYGGADIAKCDGEKNIYFTMYGEIESAENYPADESAINYSKNSINQLYFRSVDTAINNMHINIKKGRFSRVVGTTTQKNVNFMGFNLDNCAVDGYVAPIDNDKNTTTKPKINELSIKFSGTNAGSYSISDVFVGGNSNSSAGNLLQFEVDKAIINVETGGYVKNLYGGGNQVGTLAYFKDLVFNVNGGTVTNLYGGGLGGFVGTESNPSKISINVNSGTVGNLYGGGSGGYVKLYSSSGTLSYSGYTLDNTTKPQYGYKGTTFYYSAFDSGNTDYIPFQFADYYVKETGVTYQAIRIAYTYTQNKNKDYSKLSDYYQVSSGSAVSDAAVVASSINININGGTINNNVYGGGKNGSVTANNGININFNGGTIKKNIYGGGEGLSRTFEQTVQNGGKLKIRFTNNPDDLTTSKFEDYINSDTESNLLYNKACQLNSVFSSRYIMTGAELKDSNFGYYDGTALNVYSDTIDRLGKIIGNTNISLKGGTVKGDVFGGSNGEVANISGNSLVILEGSKVTNIFGGGNNGVVGGDAEVIINSGKISNVYGGGNNADVLGSEGTSVIVDGDVKIDSLFGGGNKGASNKTSVNINSGSITTLYGGANEANVNGDVSLTITGGKVLDTFGGNNTSGKISGNINVNVSNINDDVNSTTNLYGGGNLASYEGLVTLTFNSGKVTNLYGGGKQAAIGEAKVTINNGNITNVFGGGDQGITTGNISVKVVNGNINTLYGGANKANINGSVSVDIDGGNIINTFGGNNESGKISGNIVLTIDNLNSLYDGTDDTYLYGGGNLANYEGLVTLTFNSGKVTNLYGGGKKATIGNANIVIENSEIANVFGGGDQGITLGNIILSVKNSNIEILYGGANKADINGNVNTTINGGTIDNTFGGNNLSGVISGNVTLDITSLNSNYVYGGGNMASVTGLVTLSLDSSETDYLYGGGKAASVGSATVTVNESSIDTLFGGGDEGETLGNVSVSVTDSNIDVLYGGANEANITGNVDVDIDNSNIVKTFGGNNLSGVISGDVILDITDLNKTYLGVSDTYVYGGGNMADISGSVTLNFESGIVTELYGGANEADIANDVNLNISGGNITTVYGGNNASGDISGSIKLTVDGGNIETLYGGGNVANFNGLVTVTVSDGYVSKNLYGGGKNANIKDSSVNIKGGTIDGNVYGGGYAGTSDTTSVTIDNSDGKKVVIGNSVFGGGEGITATVYTSSTVDIDLDFTFSALESEVSVTSGETSGEIKTNITYDSNQSVIKGSVYGGGDLGQVGVGVIDLGSNSASISKVGTTKVVINNGHIEGSVFGAGNGVPSEGVTYKVEMGAIFGKTSATVYGGYIEGNLYGGGRQSRLYAENGSLDNVATVLIDEQGSKNIAIKGSVFGGGDRGSSTTTNASVPTTIGNVLVTINGNSEGSKIYFVDGGVYGDGNLCLVSGYRKIEIVNFTLNADKKLKTFYSLQRADEVIINNSDFVLLGAIDLVEEGDYTIYSINRIDNIKMENGSTIKLSRIVKLLGAIESDVDTDRKFISKGNNGKNDYSGHGEPDAITALKADEISSYINSSTLNGVEISKNTICVANGLYLEIKETETKYGKVKGLFTLELLYANPGEGGGFVYSDILSSTGDFICETVMAHIFEARPELTESEYNSNPDKYYVRVTGREYSTTAGFVSGKLYYEKIDNSKCMEVVDNAGGKKIDSKFEYYYWYIAGTLIKYEVSVEGFIGSPETEFKKDSIIPEHETSLTYILYGISEATDKALSNALDKGIYTLVTEKDGLEGQQISIEVKFGEDHVGYLVYDKINGWGIRVSESTLYGYQGFIEKIDLNVLYDFNSQSPNNYISLVLHKATTVNTEIRDMKFTVEMDIYKTELIGSDTSYQAYTDGTSTLVFNTNVSIIRLVPVQSTYSDESRFYNGVGLNNENIRINGYSSITVEYQTAYIPLAYPYIEGTSSFDWMLSTLGYSYYFNMAQGTYLTLCGDKVVNISSTLKFDGSEKESTDDSVMVGTIYQSAIGEYWYKDTDESIYVLNNNTVTTTKSVFPKGTKITLIDLTDDKNPTYFYYICYSDEEVIDLNEFLLMGSSSVKLKVCDTAFKKSYNDYQ